MQIMNQQPKAAANADLKGKHPGRPPGPDVLAVFELALFIAGCYSRSLEISRHRQHLGAGRGREDNAGTNDSSATNNVSTVAAPDDKRQLGIGDRLTFKIVEDDGDQLGWSFLTPAKWMCLCSVSRKSPARLVNRWLPISKRFMKPNTTIMQRS